MPDSSRPGILRSRGAAAQHDRVVLAPQTARRQIDADLHAGAELHALGAHEIEPPIEETLLELEIRYAVAQQPADAIRALEHGDVMSGAVQLIRRGQARGSGADNRDAPAGTSRGR